MSISKFETISLEGGLLSVEYLQTIARISTQEQNKASYNVPAGHSLRDEINRGWKIARALRQEKQGGITNQQFAQAFLNQVLGFGELQAYSPQMIDNNNPNTPTHLAKNGAIPIVIAPTDEGLDKRQDGLLVDKKITPFNQAQIYLNNSEEHLWGVVCDGNTLRLLRNSTRMTRAAYIEADLQRILEEGENGHYSDFSLLYLIAHASRFTPPVPATCYLEQWREADIETGIRARDHLRDGVENALKALGSGFLRHPANTTSLEQVLEQNDGIDNYYRELLWLAYRLIFLLVTEDRRLLQGDNISKKQKTVYSGGYSVSRLRERASHRYIKDNHDDLWEGLKHTFNAMGGGDLIGSGSIGSMVIGGSSTSTADYLGLPTLGGLFEKNRCPTLDNCRLYNSDLLQAVHCLSWITDNNNLTRVNYRDMGADELGSIYESLLELSPKRVGHDEFRFYDTDSNEGAGNARRTSGSYYTAPALVDELIKSTLQPILDKATSEEDLLALRVLDPACGSGHFLLAAARSMATKLFQLRDDNKDNEEDNHNNYNENTSQETAHRHRLALRDVISHCICGVDKNPMALDLAKTALWLEAFDSEKTLIFLDHHLQCGDSLLGVLNLDLLGNGIPNEAYTAATGDDISICLTLKNGNKSELKDNRTHELYVTPSHNLAAEAAAIEAMPEDDLAQVADKHAAYQALESKRATTGISVAADMFTAAFLMPKQSNLPLPPTSRNVRAALVGDIAKDSTITKAAQRCAADNSVFHWWLRYPTIQEKGGFDVILANPPWERIELQEQEFFARRNPDIAQAKNKHARSQLINQLGVDEDDNHGRKIMQEYTKAKHAAETASTYVHKSRQYPLTGVGKINTYALFSELCLKLSHKNGAAGIITPTNIATDDTTKIYFNNLIENKRLKSLYDFENRKGLFPSVHRMYRFSLLTIAYSEVADFSIFAHQITDLQDQRRHIKLTANDLRLVNPNTGTMPLYRTQYDRNLCEKIYHAAPILWCEQQQSTDGSITVTEKNPWQVKFQSMFNMSTDSKLFQSESADGLVRLYEAKYMHQYDHRWATYEHKIKKSTVRDLQDEEKQNPDTTIASRYYVDEKIVLARVANIPVDLRRAVNDSDAFWCIARDWLAGHSINNNQLSTPLFEFPSLYADYTDYPQEINSDKAIRYAQEVPLNEQEIKQLLQVENIIDFLRIRSPKWLMGWRNITRAVDKSTLTSSVLPLSAVGDSISTIYMETDSTYKVILLSILNSLTIDYVIRQKMAGINLNHFYLKQLPILPPDAFTPEDIQAIVQAVLELSYTAHDMKPFYDDIMQDNPTHYDYDPRPQHQQGTPFAWDTTRRATLRAAIDARIAHKYGLSRDDLRYMLDPAEIMGEDYPSETFRILKSSEMKQHGEYRTRRLVLAAYDALTSP